jgi:DNA polymerase-3 subunit chi
MTRIDFHSNVSDKILYTCRLIRKARAAACRVVVFDSDRKQLEALNDALWTFSESDFLPHVMMGDPLMAQTPIILTDNVRGDFPHHELLINLTQHAPDDYSRFERLIEVISSDPQDTQAGRERYRIYQQQGATPTHTVAKTL